MPLPARLTGEEYDAQLKSAGVSDQAIEGIHQVLADGKKSFSNYGPSPSFHDAIESVTKLFVDLETFIKTQSEEDQKAYHEFSVKRGAEYRD